VSLGRAEQRRENEGSSGEAKGLSQVDDDATVGRKEEGRARLRAGVARGARRS
jgi:hypothetical protein